MANINDINIPKSPFLDTQSNRPTREWLMYLLGLGRTFVYGAFSSTTIQSQSVINTPKIITFDNTDYANLTYYTAGDGVRVKQSGLYNVQFSIQLTNTDTQSHDVDVWFRLNGVDIPNTASLTTVQGTHGGQPGYAIIAANFFVQINAGDYLEMWWASNSLQVQLNYLPPITTPFVSPGSPSVVLTLNQINF